MLEIIPGRHTRQNEAIPKQACESFQKLVLNLPQGSAGQEHKEIQKTIIKRGQHLVGHILRLHPADLQPAIRVPHFPGGVQAR